MNLVKVIILNNRLSKVFLITKPITFNLSFKPNSAFLAFSPPGPNLLGYA
jgi:hypothetical protein